MTEIEPGSNESPSEAQAPRFSMVGLGASAGGLEALTKLIAQLPADLGLTYVVVQHMSPTHRSMMAQLLGRETRMKVKEVEDGETPRVDVIYITPPNSNLTLLDGNFHLIEPEPHAVPKPSINAFFSSLSEARGEEAIAVVLSGTGSDGASGVRLVKAAGGLVFAQEPGSAKYDGMPRSAIETGCTDLILPPEAIAAEIALLVRTAGQVKPPTPADDAPISIPDLLSRVLRHTRVDFSGYKEATVWRRILRRMATNRVGTLEQYVELTERNPDELSQLSKEILISVTSFFRDAGSFEALRATLSARLDTKRAGDEFRVWVPGCATGEEAYSIAIVLRELIAVGAPSVRLQIFATDIDMGAMGVARRGMYSSSSLADMPADLVKRYFTPGPEGYEISKSIRELVVFARQDLVQDPPFLRLDLVSCRNVLIYFQGALQEKVLGSFHYALLEDGLLFLGKSESVQHREQLFSMVSRDGKVFRRRDVVSRPHFAAPAVSVKRQERPERERAPLQLLLEVAAGAYVPPSVLLDDSASVLHIYGDVSAFLQIPSGRPDLNVLNLIRKELRSELQSLIHQCRQRSDTAFGRSRTESPETSDGAVRMVVRPVPGSRRDSSLLLTFERMPQRKIQGEETSDSGDAEVRELEHELVATREHLQTLIEELETSNEETQALNEELQSSNEELQAANEELQSANEELQSTNEELTTVNEELQVKTAELVDVNGDLESIQDSIGFALLMVSEQMRVQRFNRYAAQLFELSPGTAGVPLERVLAQRKAEHCSGLVADVLRDGMTREDEVSFGGRHYSLRCCVRETQGIGITGAIITLTDQTDLIIAQRELQASRSRLVTILDNSNALIVIKSTLGRIEYANPRYAATIGHGRQSLNGLTDEDLLTEDESRMVRHADLTVLASARASETEETLTVDGMPRHFRTLRFVLRDDEGEITALCSKLQDITAYRQEVAEWRSWMNGWRELVIALDDVGIIEFDADRVITWQGGTPSVLDPITRLGGGERTIQGALEALGFDIRSFEGARSGLWNGQLADLQATAHFSEHGGMCLVQHLSTNLA